ncbi:MAG TPA: 8-oxoguanine deaminase [Actinomycetes bacterium]|jgi:cytosine/adenosine deaminase-related metal-dependent hydrolase|nr:8-oxoguanine deaminase [Actinomycetes bacterium]
MSGTLVVEGATVVTVDASDTEHASGHVVVTDNRIVAVGAGPARETMRRDAGRVVDGTGCVLTPGLVNTHQHLYQWATRGVATDATLFEWLTALYPVWAGIDEETVHDAAAAALGWLARTGCTTSTDHHYVFPAGGGDLLGATVTAAAEVGLRFHPTRGSMDLGRSDGGLPPDSVVEDRDAVLAATETAITRFHDTAEDAMVRVAVAPCSPFSVTAELMTEAAELARRHGVRLHTHLAETADEDEFCRDHFGATPTEYVDSLGWLGPDVWLAHAVHLDDGAVARLAASGTGVAHCPSSNARLGAGIARTRDLVDAGVAVGLGVDGAASNEAGSLLEEARHAALMARARGGPRALSARAALRLATHGGARVLGRDDAVGSIEIGKVADLALWRVDTLAHAGIADPVTALVLGSQPPLELLLVDGRPVVERDRLVRLDEDELARAAANVSRRLLESGGVGG